MQENAGRLEFRSLKHEITLNLISGRINRLSQSEAQSLNFRPRHAM